MKNAYRKLSLKYHPDKTNIDQSDTKFKEVTEAYQFLKSHQKRVKKTIKNDVGSNYADFWQKQYEEQYEHGFNHRENFRNEFHIKSPNQEKPVSHKIFHITIFGGLALITLWIVLSEILK
jgi:molecular chaperone DnaJ|tara:strand:+ start:1451 stop:1810 length:360 start_codon:yes stop_codon:yes gene_type:complete